MTKLGYIDEFNEEEKPLLNEMWETLIPDLTLSNDQGILQRNLCLFLYAIENIFLEEMSLNYVGNSNKRRKKFGFFVSEFYYVEDEKEVQKMCFHFDIFVQNKQSRLI